MERRFSLIKRYYVFLILLLISTGVFACQRETREKPDSLSLIVKNGKYGYIDRTGKIVITSQFDGAWQFSGGLALVKVGDKWGYIDRSGKMVIKPQFDAAESFFEGSPKLKIGGCIDKAGRMVINAQFDDAEGVTSGLARVSIGDKSNYIDKEGQYVLGPINQFK